MNPQISHSEPADIVLSALAGVITLVEQSIHDLQRTLGINTDLTARQRSRLIGTQARNYGFVTSACEIVAENAAFQPTQFSVPDMAKNLAILDKAKQLTLAADRLRRLADDFQLLTSDTVYREALRVYGNLREMNNANVAGAEPLFEALSQFFAKRRQHSDEAKPTEKELERDFKKLMHGKADGEMIVRHESPHKEGGVHEVVDDVHKHGRHGAEMKVKEEE